MIVTVLNLAMTDPGAVGKEAASPTCLIFVVTQAPSRRTAGGLHILERAARVLVTSLSQATLMIPLARVLSCFAGAREYLRLAVVCYFGVL
jgi:hypothetical protein